MEYIGQHKTANINDGYMGSGTRLINAISKHGIGNFNKEILFVYDNFDSMNLKEMELVNEEYISRPDTYNIIKGGIEFDTSSTVCVVIDETTNTYGRIPCNDYDPLIHKTPSTGYVSVYFNDGSSGRISVTEFNPLVHKKVFGGAVGKVNGVAQYVDKSDIGVLCDGIHKGKVTVYDDTGVCKHVTVEEFHNNRHLYKTGSQGKIPVKCKTTNKHYQIKRSEYDKNPNKWIVGTTGQLTVYDIETATFIQITKGAFDVKRHRYAQDKYFICYNELGHEVMHFWGSKKAFTSIFKPTSMYTAAINSTTFRTNRKHTMNGWSFKLIDWKSSTFKHTREWTGYLSINEEFNNANFTNRIQTT